MYIETEAMKLGKWSRIRKQQKIWVVVNLFPLRKKFIKTYKLTKHFRFLKTNIFNVI